MPGTSSMDSLPSSATGVSGRSPALHEGMPSGHIRTVGGTKRTRPSRDWEAHPPTGRAIERFFRENPDEELTKQDAALKFGVSMFTARDTLLKLEKQGLVKSFRSDENPRTNVYRSAA